jgi:ATP-dependent Clp protease ATP-binding subunit ClpA
MSKHDKLYPEHILLGIIGEGTGPSSKLLKVAGVDLNALRELISQKSSPSARLSLS